LLIPLLSKLGYSENDWTRQLSQKQEEKKKQFQILFFSQGEIHFQNAPLVMRSKI
jgi:hypothetical protein